jgi:GH25 family lysozyme M1 (1,4-beta-N-acetylmuramidase)
MEALSITSRPRKREADEIVSEPMPPGRRLTGVDVSKWQGEVNWRRVAEDHTFAIVKATEGVGYVDPKFRKNVALAGATSIRSSERTSRWLVRSGGTMGR